VKAEIFRSIDEYEQSGIRFWDKTGLDSIPD
jgi:hypothetical protein